MNQAKVMEPTEREVVAHFRALDDLSLLSLAEQRDELTAESERLLLAELNRRKLAVPNLPRRADLSNESAETWVTVERFRDLSSGIVARGALEAAAIPCFLRDENTVRLDWQISNFIGGMRLQVRAEDESIAKEMLQGLSLQDEIASDTGESLADERCPACGSTHLRRRQRYHWFSMLSVWLLGTPVPLRAGPPTWQCDVCQAMWQDVD